jgi:hypothetical protein
MPEIGVVIIAIRVENPGQSPVKVIFPSDTSSLSEVFIIEAGDLQK